MVTTICSTFRRIFGILLMISRPKSIIEFVKLGIDDTNLPLTEKRGGKPYINWRLVGRAKLFASTRGKPSNTKTSVIGNTPFLHHSLRGRKGRFAILDWTPNESNSPSTRYRENIVENVVDPLSTIKFHPLSCDFGDFPVRTVLLSLLSPAHDVSSSTKKALSPKTSWKSFLSKVYS